MNPVTREEMFLAAAAGEYDGPLPAPVTRSEFYLKIIAENLRSLTTTDNVTEAELSEALAGKAAASHSHAQSDVTGLEAALLAKADSAHVHDDRYYTEGEMDAKLGEKSNTGHSHDDRYYTEGEMDTKLSGKANVSDIPDVSVFITRAVNDLTNYYTKSQTYTQTEIDNMVSAIPKFAIEVVSALPTQNISPTTVYLLTVQNGGQGNMYDEYIHVGNNWELLGSQTVDLSGYYTAAQVDALLSGLSLAAHTHDDRYYTESEIDGKIQTINAALLGKAALSHDHDDRYYTEAEMDNKLGEKSNTGHSHTTADVTGLDSALLGKADSTAVGTLANLQTTAKSSLVAAVNEVKGLLPVVLFSDLAGTYLSSQQIPLSDNVANYRMVEVITGIGSVKGAVKNGSCYLYLSSIIADKTTLIVRTQQYYLSGNTLDRYPSDAAANSRNQVQIIDFSTATNGTLANATYSGGSYTMTPVAEVKMVIGYK